MWRSSSVTIVAADDDCWVDDMDDALKARDVSASFFERGKPNRGTRPAGRGRRQWVPTQGLADRRRRSQGTLQERRQSHCVSCGECELHYGFFVGVVSEDVPGAVRL